MRIGVVVGLIFALLGANSPLISAQSTGNYQKTLQLGHRFSQTVDWNFDGSMLAVGSEGEVRIYSYNLQELNFIEAQGNVTSVDWNSNANKLAIAVVNFRDATSSIYIWDSSNATLTQAVVINQTMSGQFLVAWSSDNTVIATSDGSTVQLWDAQTGQAIPLTDATGISEINSLDWSTSSDFLVATNERGISYIWDTSTDILVNTIEVANPFTPSISPDGSMLASTDTGNQIYIWEISTGSLLKTLQGHTNRVADLEWNITGLASVSFEDSIKIWDVGTGVATTTFSFVNVSGLTIGENIAWSPNLEELAVAEPERLYTWDTTSENTLGLVDDYTDSIIAAMWHPTDDKLLTSELAGRVRIWDINSGELLVTLGDFTFAHSVAWNPDGSNIVIGEAGSVSIINSTTGILEYELSGPVGSINAVSWSPDGSKIASGGSDGSLKIWDATTHNLIVSFDDHVGQVRSIAWSPDSTTIASSSDNSTVKIWDISSQMPSHTFSVNSDRIATLAWNLDGSFLAGGGNESNIYIWDMATLTLDQTLVGHSARVNSISWKSNTELASGSTDRTVRIWDINSSGEIAILEHNDFIQAVSWNTNQTKLATGSGDAKITIWEEVEN